jgi:enoyl-CoA hydratase/carnithine racemase
VTDEALRRGWIDEVAEPEDLVEDALAVARELSLLSPAAFTQTKMQIRQRRRAHASER